MRYPLSDGNVLTLHIDGGAAFEAAYAAIARAQSRVWLEMYIFEPDEVGHLALEALAAAARRGCDVILLFDRWGSPRFNLRYARPLLDAGGRVAVYNPVLPWRKLGRKLAPLLHRDHRKILIADDVGFCGGRNVSREYGGQRPERFYDLTLQVEGPVVQDLADALLGSLRMARGTAPALPPRHALCPNGVPAQVLVLNRRRNERDLDLALHDALHSAVRQVFLMTPYFIPPLWFREALVQAAQRGVDVRLFTAGRSDVPLAHLAGRHLYCEMLGAGVRIYEMRDPTLHAKCITIDSHTSIVGSYNVDAYGGKHNLEVGIASTDARLAELLEREFYENAGRAEEVTLEVWHHQTRWQRLVSRALYHLLSL